MTLFTTAGWLICGILALLLVFQLRNTRDIRFPRRGQPDSWPPLSIIFRASRQPMVQECLKSVARQSYDGDFDILVLIEPSDANTITLAEQLAIANPRLRVIETESRDLRELDDPTPSGEAERYWLVTGNELLLDPDAAATAVGHAMEWNLDTLVLTPGLSPSSTAEKLLAPLVPFLRVTFFPQRLILAGSANDQFLLSRRPFAGTPEVGASGRSEVTNGRFLISRTAKGRSTRRVTSEVAGEIGEAMGDSSGRMALFAVLLLILFVLPPLAAITSGDRAWLMATLIGLFLRLRSAVRTGEPLVSTLLHPVAVATLALAMATGGRRQSHPPDESRPV